jgi:hypothetical protein
MFLIRAGLCFMLENIKSHPPSVERVCVIY